MNKQEIKRYLVSSAITFVAVFLLTFLPYVSEITWESLKTGAILSLVIAAMRAGIKASVELLIPYIQTFINKE